VVGRQPPTRASACESSRRAPPGAGLPAARIATSVVRPRRASACRWLAVLLAAAASSCKSKPTPAVDAAPPGAQPQQQQLRAIRVCLLAGVRSFRLAVDGPFELRDGQGRRLSPQGHRLEPTEAVVLSGSSPRIRIGPNTYDRAVVEIIPKRPGSLEVFIPTGADKPTARRYRGTLRCVLQPDGTADVINVVDVEQYLRGVLRGEMPPWFHREAFRAQAIASRTFVLYQKMTVGRWRHYDVEADQRSQMYIGLDGEKDCPQAIEAVESTRGVVCTWASPYGEKIFCTYFSACCGGMTQDAANVKPMRSIPPLAGGVRCTYCVQAPCFQWGPVRYSKSRITAGLRARYPKLAAMSRVEKIEVLSATADGRPIRLKIIDSQGRTVTMRAEDFRLAVDPSGMTLKSTHFRIHHERDHILFTHGRGWGHGIGMCQYGADGLARRGKKAADILRFYYPTCHLTKAYE